MTRTAAALLALAFAASASAPSHAKKKDVFTYKVQQGDTLECLDQKAGIQPGELAMLNGKPGKMDFKLVAGSTINTPIKVKPNLCAGFKPSGGAKGAKPPLKEQACALIDRANKYSQAQAIALLHKIQENKACLKAAEIAAQPSIEALCKAVGTLLHAHHATHAYAEGIEVLCEAGHIVAHGVHESEGSAAHKPAKGKH
jgi:LysM repeat protein